MTKQVAPPYNFSVPNLSVKVSLFPSPTSPLLAVARSDSTVEVWINKHTLVLQRISHPEPHTESVSVETLAWGGDRLYSCGLHGQVVHLQRLFEECFLQWACFCLVPG